MAISEKIQKKAEDIDDERITNPNGPFPIAAEVQTKATNAILGGPEEWLEYVKMFAASPEELARLTPSEATEFRRPLAYLAANGMCGETTTGNLMNNVTVDLDV